MSKTALIAATVAAILGICFSEYVATSTRTVLAATPTPVGFYDGERLLKQSTTAKAALDAATASVADLRAAATRAASDYQNAAGPLAVSTVDTKRAAAEEAVDKYNQALRKVRETAAASIDARVAGVVAKIATARRMTFVLPVAGKLPYSSPEADLTDAVVAALDAGGK